MKNLAPRQKAHNILQLVIGVYNYERIVIIHHVFSPNLYV